MRYWNRFDVQFDVDECCYSCKILKLSLQPIIENSIIHGLDNRRGKLLIQVTCERTVDTLILRIQDNGMGIDRETLERLNNRTHHGISSGEGFGIGLSNVNERISLEFGEDYGITISSTIGEGTVVRMVLPLIKE